VIVGVNFTQQEEILYRAVEDRFRELINQSFKDGDEEKKQHILPQITYTRQ